jgi:hypothetical protein
MICERECPVHEFTINYLKVHSFILASNSKMKGAGDLLPVLVTDQGLAIMHQESGATVRDHPEPWAEPEFRSIQADHVDLPVVSPNSRELRVPIRQDANDVAFAISAHGARIGVRMEAHEHLEEILRQLPHQSTLIEPSTLDREYQIIRRGPDEEPHAIEGFYIHSDDKLAAFAPDGDQLVSTVASLLQISVAEYARPHLFIHAGVVGLNGTAIVLPGSSFAGKSTLVAALVNAGATYFSDEYAVLDMEGQVHPYARDLSLRDGPLGPSARIDLRHRGPCGDDADKSLSIRTVAMLKFKHGSGWQVEKLSNGMGVLAICEHVVAIRRRPADALSILGKVVETASVFQGIRGDLDSAVSFLTDNSVPRA